LLMSLGVLAAALLILFFYTRKLSGEDLRKYDRPIKPFTTASASDGLDRLNIYLDAQFGGPAVSGTSKSGWVGKRERFDQAGLSRTDLKAEFRPAIIDVDGHKMSGSWTLIEGHDPSKRILYLHGGGFTVGSDISHRALTTALATRTGAAVFAPNYRLMPENTRRAGVIDARTAYDWILETGPDGVSQARAIAVAGDSAGGNLTLMIANWSRNTSRRQADAILAFSPITDSSFSSPSIKANLSKDRMLRPLIAPLTKMPRRLILLLTRKLYGMSPSHPDISPIFENLSNLPPTFLIASSDETLHDDSLRYATKMEMAGSEVIFQSWAGGLPHVWPIFDNYIAEANAALDEVGAFLNAHI